MKRNSSKPYLVIYMGLDIYKEEIFDGWKF